MRGLLENFHANYKAIIHSTKLCPSKKNTLLKNLLTDIDLVFFDIGTGEKFVIEYQEEAKLLCQDINKSLIS